MISSSLVIVYNLILQSNVGHMAQENKECAKQSNPINTIVQHFPKSDQAVIPFQISS